MATALVLSVPEASARQKSQREKSFAHRLGLFAVWLTVASSSIVFIEPAPADALAIGLLVLLPTIGLMAWKRSLLFGLGLWLAASAFGYVSGMRAIDFPEAMSHQTISLYLSLTCFIFAGFVAQRPAAHTRLILNAVTASAFIAAALAIIGYLDLSPGAYDMFTRYDRASGPFKDPNVLGPFLMTGLVTVLYQWLNRPMARGFTPILIAVVLGVAILFTFSRGAWAATAFAVALYGFFYTLTAERDIDRLKFAGLIMAGAAALVLVVTAAWHSPSFSNLLEERAALTQPYDEGPEGRFGGQEKAINLILDNPLGIGAHNFSPFYHHEEPHNVYLSMMLNAGWAGGLIYALICAGTLIAGYRHILKPTATRPLFLIVYCVLAANIAEGLLIDSDHWRHFYLLMGVVWGLMAGDRRIVRAPRIVADVRPVLMRPVLVLPPSRRESRITGKVAPMIAAPVIRGLPARRCIARRRPKRITGTRPKLLEI
jgi:O-antigen ligase